MKKKIGERTGVSPRNGNAWKMAEFFNRGTRPIPKAHGVSGFRWSAEPYNSFRVAQARRTVSFALEYQGRWFNEIKAWGIMEYVAGESLPETKVAEAATDRSRKTRKNHNQEQKGRRRPTILSHGKILHRDFTQREIMEMYGGCQMWKMLGFQAVIYRRLKNSI